jgi:hypothetical protein
MMIKRGSAERREQKQGCERWQKFWLISSVSVFLHCHITLLYNFGYFYCYKLLHNSFKLMGSAFLKLWLLIIIFLWINLGEALRVLFMNSYPLARIRIRSYVMNRSFWMDAHILLKTIPAVFHGVGAY